MLVLEGMELTIVSFVADLPELLHGIRHHREQGRTREDLSSYSGALVASRYALCCVCGVSVCLCVFVCGVCAYVHCTCLMYGFARVVFAVLLSQGQVGHIL